MNIVIMHGAIVAHDAIGNDIANLYRVLGDRHEPVIYGDLVHVDGLRQVDREQAETLLADPGNLVVYHHSIHWPAGEEMLDSARARVVIRFHNITPPEFFQSYNADYAGSCKAGRDQTARLARRHADALWLADSTFNLDEAGLVARANAHVVPPFNNAAAWRHIRPDEEILRSLVESRRLNLLFIGRVAPNKGYRFLFEVVRDYRSHYDELLVLHLVGKRDPNLASFNNELDELVRSHGIENSVHWTGELSEPALLAYFLGCDFYLSCSEHEGFCVPLVESQCLHLPLVARRGGAVVETLAAEQLILDDDPSNYSAALQVLSRSRAYRDHLVRTGAANYARRFTVNAIATRFRRAVEDHLGERL